MSGEVEDLGLAFDDRFCLDVKDAIGLEARGVVGLCIIKGSGHVDDSSSEF